MSESCCRTLRMAAARHDSIPVTTAMERGNSRFGNTHTLSMAVLMRRSSARWALGVAKSKPDTCTR
jgi:hypothetical protein